MKTMTVKDLTNHKQKRIQTVAKKLIENNTVRLSKSGEIEASFKIMGILGKDKVSVKRVDYSSDYIVTVREL